MFGNSSTTTTTMGAGAMSWWAPNQAARTAKVSEAQRQEQARTKKPRCHRCTRPVAVKDALCSRCDPTAKATATATATPLTLAADDDAAAATATTFPELAATTAAAASREQEHTKKPRCQLCTRALLEKGAPCSRCGTAPT